MPLSIIAPINVSTCSNLRNNKQIYTKSDVTRIYEHNINLEITGNYEKTLPGLTSGRLDQRDESGCCDDRGPTLMGNGLISSF